MLNFEPYYFQGWYNPTLKDFDESLVRNIMNIEENDLPYLLNTIKNGTGLKVFQLPISYTDFSEFYHTFKPPR